ncbi:MAG: aminoglycoside phosphotransferase family protein [Halorhodospira sp.]
MVTVVSPPQRMHAGAAAGRSWVLMDAPGQQPAVAAFLRVAALLAEAGVHAPQVVAAAPERGLVLLADLGRQTYLAALRGGADPAPLLDAAVGALVRWQAATRPGVLPSYGRETLAAELRLFTDWYLPCCCGISAQRARRRLDPYLEALLDRIAEQPQVFVHRDYMPRNLMVCRPLPGVLDFQDAALGPVAYDPVCLLRDAFISWPRAREVATLARYYARALEAGVPVPAAFGAFWSDCQWVGVQRHLKVLGIFARLCYRDGKPGYLADAPRFFGYLRAAAEEEPRLAPLVREALALAGEAGAEPAPGEGRPCGR